MPARLGPLVALLVGLAPSSPVAAGGRMALVVGNQDYAALPDLPNAAADARLVAERLERIGFAVELASDVDRAGLARALDRFPAGVPGKEAALLYFAGHGVQVDGINWLLPTSARIAGREDLGRDGLALDRLLERLREAGPEVGIVVLDACRDNPLGALPGSAPVGAARGLRPSRGLARTGAPTGLFIAYATAPGQVAFDGPPGGNGPFARALANLIVQPGLEISILFRRVREQVMATTAGLQQPWTEESLTRELYLVPPDPASPDPLARLNRALADADPWRRAAGLAELARAEPGSEPGRLAASALEGDRARLARARPTPDPLGAAFADRQRVLLLAGTAAGELAAEAYAALHGTVPPVARRSRGFRPGTGGHGAAAGSATIAARAAPEPDRLLWPLVERARRSGLVERFLALFPTSAHAAEAHLLLLPAPPAEPALPAAGEPATPLVVHLGTGPRPIPLPAGSGPLGLEAAPEGGRLLATTRDGRRLELGDEPLLLESLAFEPFAYARERVEPIALVGPDGATVLRVEVGIAIHPCDLEAGWRFDTQGVALGRYPNEVDGGPAIAACLEAVEAYPAVPRFRGQLGRARVLSGRYAEGVADLEAAAAGHLASRWMLGSLLVEGRGVPADPARGVALLRSAAEAGDPGAMNELGRLHLRGGAVPKDRDRAVDWLERAAAAGHTFAYNNLGNLLLQEGAAARAAALFTASAEAGDIFGYNNLGWLYETGRGVERDLPRALRWYARAAEAGQPHAFLNLARLLREGGPGLAPRPGARREREHLDGWQAAAEVRSGRTTLEDFDFEKPRTDLLAAEADPPPHPLADAEIYDYPGGYRDLAAGDARARLRLEEELTGHALAVGTGNASGLACGARFALEGFPRRRENRSWVVVATEIELSSERYRSSIGAPEREPFRCRIEAHELERPWRPARRTPRPVVQGPQTAIVTGPPGEEIHCDRYGRIKVKFHWDRKGREDETSSCWLRVSQAWAGAGWAAMHVPRVGQEVIVDFLEGDPDRPIVTGRVYNALSMPPWSLPGNATQSGVKSDSSKGGGGSNELRFEDRKGSEQVWLHAQKDEDIVVENDKTERVGHDETLSVGNDRSREVGGDETVSVDGEQKVTIGKSRTDTVKASEKRTVYIAQKQKVGGLRSVQVGAAQSHTVGANDSWRVIGGRKVKIGRGLGVEVGKERTTKIGQGDSLEVGGGRTSKITGDDTLEVGGSSAGKVAKDRSTEIGGGDTLKVAKGLLVEAGEQVVIKTGSAAIAMKKDGTITLTGKDVTIDASGKITLKASGNVIVKAQKIEHN